MIVKKLKEKTSFIWCVTKRNSLELYVCTSWFQKSIRRFRLDNAVNYTRELIESWNIDYIWKRIFIIICEDIWLANLYIWEIILNLYKKYKETETNETFNDSYIYKSVILLVFSLKSRENDNLYHSVLNHWLNNKEDKEFLDKYCIEKYYNSDSAKIKEEVLNMLDEDFKGYIDSKLFWIYKECLLRCWELWWKDWLNLYFINFYLIKKYNLGKSYYKNWVNEWFEKIKDLEIIINFWKLPKLIPENYVYDGHTTKWKNVYNRWVEYFFKESWLLINEVRVWDNIYTDYIKKKFS